MESSISVDVFIKPRRVRTLRKQNKKNLVKFIYVQITRHGNKDLDDIQPFNAVSLVIEQV